MQKLGWHFPWGTGRLLWEQGNSTKGTQTRKLKQGNQALAVTSPHRFLLPRGREARIPASLRRACQRLSGSEPVSATSMDSCGSFIGEVWVRCGPLVRPGPWRWGPSCPPGADRNLEQGGVTGDSGEELHGHGWRKPLGLGGVENWQTSSRTCPTGRSAAPRWQCSNQRIPLKTQVSGFSPTVGD